MNSGYLLGRPMFLISQRWEPPDTPGGVVALPLIGQQPSGAQSDSFRKRTGFGTREAWRRSGR